MWNLGAKIVRMKVSQKMAREDFHNVCVQEGGRLTNFTESVQLKKFSRLANVLVMWVEVMEKLSIFKFLA